MSNVNVQSEARPSQMFTAKKLAVCAMGLALAMATAYIRVFTMPMGGEVTLCSMLFIVLIGYWYGVGYGVTTGVAFGLFQFLIEPFFLSIPQFLLDYILAFGALGLAGAFRNSKKKWSLHIAYLVAVCGRLFFSWISGWVFFGMYAGDYGLKSGALYSIIYNGSYMAVEAAITLIIISMPHVRLAINKIKETI